jgi:hypothetical protein
MHMQDDEHKDEPPLTNEEKREVLVHLLGEVVLGAIGHMVEEEDQVPTVSEVPEGPIPQGETPEQLTEKIFNGAKDALVRQGEVNPGILSFKRNRTVKAFFVRNNPGGEFIKELIERIVRNDTPEAYAVIFESWWNEAKKEMPPEMDPEAKEAIVGIFKGRNTFQLVQVFHRDEQEHKKVVFEGDVKRIGDFKPALDVKLRDPTNDYIG